MIDTGTLGDSSKFKVITYLAEKLNEMSDKDSKPALKLMESLNKRCNQVTHWVGDEDFKSYLLELIRMEFYRRLIGLSYDFSIITRLRNYIKARTSIEHNQ